MNLGLLLVAAVLAIVFGTTRLRMHPFLVLLAVGYSFGLSAGLSVPQVLASIKDGFGGTLGHIGIVIAAGSVIGFVLEQSGGAWVMAKSVIRVLGTKRATLSMSITGALVSIPVFCDSGFVVLSSLARSLAQTTKQPFAPFAIALSLGLYTTHVFVPPTPGPMAAAGALHADVTTVMALGLAATVPVLISTYFFAQWMGRRVAMTSRNTEEMKEDGIPQQRSDISFPDDTQKPSVWVSFAPIVVPLVLIGMNSLANLPRQPLGDGSLANGFTFLGNPSVALLVGVAIVLWGTRAYGTKAQASWIASGLSGAGSILLTTGAGGAFGAVLKATSIGDSLGDLLIGDSPGTSPVDASHLGLLIPFVLAAALKTAQGSSTVAIITSASIVAPLSATLGLSSGFGPALTTLAIGAGAMTVSHANDSYFWVVSQFSKMSVSEAYRLHTTGTAVAGVTGIACVYVLSLIFL